MKRMKHGSVLLPSLLVLLGCSSKREALVCDNSSVESLFDGGAEIGAVAATLSTITPPELAIYNEIRSIADSQRSGAYNHTELVDPDAGHYEFDCSSFANYVLATASPAHFAPLTARFGGRPHAGDYASFFAELA